jgi:hypothetical protein
LSDQIEFSDRATSHDATRPTSATEPLAVPATWPSRGFMVRKDTHSRFLPIIIAMAVAMLGLIGLLLVNHGPWTKPTVQNETMIQHGTTAGSAAAVGAAVTPTEQKPEIEPAVPGPKPVAPAIPDQKKS